MKKHTGSKSQNILDMIRARQQDTTYNEPTGPTTEDWKSFKTKFVETLGGETVKQGTAKTNKELLNYIKDSTDDDKMPRITQKERMTLRKFLANLDD